MAKDKEIYKQNERLDELEAVMLSDNYPIIDLPLRHFFSKGLYGREIFMPKEVNGITGIVVMSEIHKTQHQFSISKGKVAVSIDGKDWVELEAPYHGVTEAGTRRILFIIEDCIWTTYHPLGYIKGEENNWSDEDKARLGEKIVKKITVSHVNSVNGLVTSDEYKKALHYLGHSKGRLL